MEGSATVTMATIITDISSVVTAAAGWAADFSAQIAGDPILMLGVVAVPMVGLGVGILKRLLSARV